MISKQCKTPVPQKLVFPGCPGARSSMISTGQVDVTFLPDYPAPEALRKVRCWLFKSEDATKAEVEFGQVSEMKVKKTNWNVLGQAATWSIPFRMDILNLILR